MCMQLFFLLWGKYYQRKNAVSSYAWLWLAIDIILHFQYIMHIYKHKQMDQLSVIQVSILLLHKHFDICATEEYVLQARFYIGGWGLVYALLYCTCSFLCHDIFTNYFESVKFYS